jgi:hypothetical protein
MTMTPWRRVLLSAAATAASAAGSRAGDDDLVKRAPAGGTR